ncbi:hypothetical protein EG68_09127 [Paragonimus skrjabini miyazakii]|uniref:SHSP domain-containing protein n=1 Tax=Paragonimus skrjabini miyazakii TaxID=59628 RepID=A0A8S9YLH9_9TREM|nr:hypothetical protein EG68_09127 [Paragonimus skrjabini miyazakii]
MVSKLRQAVADPSSRSPNGKEKSLPVHTYDGQLDWSKEMNKWIDGIDRTWNAEMRRIKNCLFPLVPVDLFDHGVPELLAPYGDVSSILDQMDRQMEAVRRPIETMFDKQQLLPDVGGLSRDPLDYLKDSCELVALKPLSEAEVKQRESTEHQLALKPTGTVGPTVIMDETTGGEKLQMEIPTEPDFTADDPCVRMDANHVIVSGRKQCADKTGSSKGDHVKEFTRSYEIPEKMDTFPISIQLHGNTLLMQASKLK